MANLLPENTTTNSLEKLSKLLESFLRWLREVLPTAVTVGGLVYNWMREKLRREEKAHDKTKLEKELVENELANEREFSGMSDADVIKRESGRQRSDGQSS